MKHLWTKISAAACALLAVAAVSCDSSDDAGKETFFERMEINYVYAVSQDLLSVADIQITYTDPEQNGQEKTETMTESTWSKKFQTKTFPTSLAVKVTAALKEGINLDKTSYTLTNEVTTEFLEYRNDGKIYWFQGPDVDRTASIVEVEEGNPDAIPNGVAAAIAQMNKSYSYTVTRNGNNFAVTTGN